MPELADFTIAISATLLDAAARIERNHSRAVVVVQDERVIGVLSEGDILRALLQGTDVLAPVRDFIRFDFKHLDRHDPAAALSLFQRHGFSLVPVVDHDFRLLSVVTLGEVLQLVRLAEPGR